MGSPAEKALEILKYLPRVGLNNLVKNPYIKRKVCVNSDRFDSFFYFFYGSFFCEKTVGKGTKDRKKDDVINKSNRERRRFWPVGYEGGRTPFYLKIPIENYYKDFKY